MKKKDLFKMGFNEVQAESLVEMYKRELKGYVPKTRLDEVIAERNALRIYIGEQDKRLVMLEQKITDSEELQNQISQLQISNRTMKDKLDQAKNTFKVAIEMIL